MASGGKQNVKKEKGHYVPSRYKQAAEKFSILPNSRENTTTFLKVSRDSQGSQASGNSSQDTLSCTKFGTSQEGGEKTSTPSSKGKHTFPLLDASAVTDCKRHLSTPHLKEGIGPISSDNLKRNPTRKNKLHNETLLSHGPVVASYKDKKKNERYNEKVEEAKLDIIYAEYLQAAFLEFESKKALGKRSSCALVKIHKLFHLVMLHVEKLKPLQSDLQLLSCFIKMHQHCQKQEKIFTQVLEIIPSMEEQYKSLAEAVNATKHKLNIKGVILPEPGFEGEIINLLEKTNDVLCDFFQKFKSIKDIISSAEILQSYVNVGGQIADALKRGSDLLVEAKGLLLSETSLILGCENS